MRLTIWALLGALLAPTVIAVDTPLDADASDDSDDIPKSTTFNGLEVPPLPEINGEKFDETIKDGYWFVKHYSPFCIHCQHIAPTWQTLHEFYYTSKVVPGGAEDKTTDASAKSFASYYDFHFGSLDCVAFGTTCSEHKVHGFPSFVLYKGGQQVKVFEDTRDMNGLSQFVEETLEGIHPGSRPTARPQLPEPKATSSPEYASSKAKSPSAAKPVPDVHKKQKDPTKAEASKLKQSAEKEEHDQKKAQIKQQAQNLAAEEEKRLSEGSKVAYASRRKYHGQQNPTGSLVTLDPENFLSSVTMSKDLWLVKFFAPWCHHCQAMAPTWLQLAKEMKGKLNIGEVDCVANRKLCTDVGVQGFPTIKLFRGGQHVEYHGLRGLGDFVKYANDAVTIGSDVKDITAAEFREMEEKEEVIFIYFYDHATTTEDFKALDKLVLNIAGHAKLVKTDSAILADRFKITTWPRLIVSRSGRPTYHTPLAPYDMRDYGQVLRWMQSVWMPLVPELTPYNAVEIMNGKIVVLGILTRDRPDEFMMAKNELKTAVLEWMDKETHQFQLERQELRDAKQLRIEEAEDRDDQRALRNAKTIRINMDHTNRKEVVFAWVDGVFWERWIRTTYGIDVKTQGEKIIINDEDNRQYWDQTVTGNSITPSRTAILDTIPKVLRGELTAKSTISRIHKFFFNIKQLINGHPVWCALVFIGACIAAVIIGKGSRRRRSGWVRLDDKDSYNGSSGMDRLVGIGGLLGGNGGRAGVGSGKVD